MKLVNRRRALDLLSSGRKVGAKEGIEIGLIDYECKSLQEAVARLYSTCSAATSSKDRQEVKSPGAIQAMKKLIGCLEQGNVDAKEIEMSTFESRWRSEDHVRLTSDDGTQPTN